MVSKKMENMKSDNKNIFTIFLTLIAFAFILRLMISVGYINRQDTLWYREWALSLPDGFFNVYSRADEISLDYPPIYLFFLYITGLAYRALGSGWGIMTDMLFMKFWPIFFDTLCGAALYFVFKKQGEKAGFLAALLWLFNPCTIFNSAFWGQTDGLMCLLLLISFYALESKRPILACVLFAIAGLTKYQCLFFTPIFLLELFLRSDIKRFLPSIFSAVATVLGVFLPFMIGAKNPLLFFEVYLGGQGKYPHCTLNAFNVYGMFNLNWVPDSKKILGLISVGTLSTIVTVLLIVGVFLIYIFAKNKCMWTVSFLFMSSLFMFMSRMHERYAFVTLIFILVAAVKHKNKGLFISFLLSSAISLTNHFVPMFSWNDPTSVFATHYNGIFVFMSFVSVAVYIVTTYICLCFVFKGEQVDLLSITEN